MKNKKIKMIIGFMLLPIFVMIYFIDRAFLVFLPIINGHTIRKWFGDVKIMGMSTIRVSVLVLIYIIYLLLQMRTNG